MPERTVCDAQEHATEAEYLACPICNPPAGSDPSRIDGQTVKTRPAGSIYPETEWSIPSDDYVRSWLGEARQIFREHQHARAIGRVMDAHRMQRIIRLVMRIDAEREVAENLRQQMAEQERMAEEEIGRLKYALSTTNAVLDSQSKLLEGALGYLDEVRRVVGNADDEFNFSGDQDPDGAPDA